MATTVEALHKGKRLAEAELEAAQPAPKLVSIVGSYHGELYGLRDDGKLFKRVPDPAPRSTPGAVGLIWVEIPGP